MGRQKILNNTVASDSNKLTN